MTRITLSMLTLLFSAWACAEPFETKIRPLLQTYCLDCHSTEAQEGELDLQRFDSLDLVRADATVWQEVLRQIADGEMPPKDQPQFTAEERTQFTDWVQATLDDVARANAGDPGSVLLRRLSNREYTYTLQDLTGVPSLDPASEFPVDGAAGEGFTNVGSALVMSPGLFTKYLDAAKEIASHAVILPERIAFSASTSRADWTQEKLDAIRELYAQFTLPGAETDRDLQGVRFSTTDGRVIPVERYLRAIHSGAIHSGAIHSGAIHSGDIHSGDIHSGDTDGLSPKYLGLLKTALEDEQPSILLDPIRDRWRQRNVDDLPAIAEQIGQWQQALWHFAKVGHIGKRDGPKAWQVPVMPVATTQSVRLQLPDSTEDATESKGMVTIYLAAGNAGDGADGDVIVWKDARLLLPSGQSIALRQVESLVQRTEQMLQRELARTSDYLDVVAAAYRSEQPVEVLAGERDLSTELAKAWWELVQLHPVSLSPSGYLTGKQTNVGGYQAIRGWGEGLPVLLANQADDDLAFSTLRVPARGVTVHPTPEIDSVIYWKSPIEGKVSIEGLIADMDGVCGNGAAWSIEVINAHGSQRLAGDAYPNGGRHEFGPVDDVSVTRGDLIKLTVQSRDQDHSCDTTQIALAIRESRPDGYTWDLASEIVDRLHEGNPLSDRQGNPGVWHFCQSQAAPPGHTIPSDSALGRWRGAVIEGGQADTITVQKQMLGPSSDSDRAISETCRQLLGPLRWFDMAQKSADEVLDQNDLEQVAPSILEFEFPNSMVAGAKFLATVGLHPDKGSEGSVQAFASLQSPPNSLPLVPGRLLARSEDAGTLWTDGEAPVVSDRPILVRDGSDAHARILRDITEFQSLFPAALCYDKIVPVDEVVTLTLRYREDEHLQRLMLNDQQRSQLNQLWDEMLSVSRQPLQQLDAYNQLWQYATQDADPSAFEPMREPITQAAADFEQRLVALEPAQLQMTLDFAAEAWRRPLRETEQLELRDLYRRLREQALPHESAIRQLITRVLVAPSFLYRGESAPPGRESAPVNDWELATRLSYFLTSSAPDAELRADAAAGRLRDPEVLVAQTRRMLGGNKVRRLATEFGCQWLHVRDLESLDEKSERHFPTFVGLRGDMQEEITRFFIDLFQRDRSILSLLDADHTFMNAALANHYGVEFDGDDWQRVDGVRALGRGGILGFAGTLAKQSGASRTSPILRGNWVSETVLGERLPRPPKDVPVLPDEAPEGLTERELIERHSSVAECARCHERIDPFGFALEGFDAIGRRRIGLNTAASLADGTAFEGIEGLRSYLLNTRRDDFLRQFCRKLLGYALGRGIQLSDAPFLDRMVRDLEQNDDRVGFLVESIVLSPQFRNVRGREMTTVHRTTDQP